MAALLVTLALSPPAAQTHRPGVGAYSGAGAWVDRYDYVKIDDPEAAVGEMSDHGVRTLYLETASWRVPRNVDIVDPDTTERMIVAAHSLGMQVVAWYLPGLADRRIDMRRIRAALDFQTLEGQRFDSFALDIEANEVNPVWKRNASLLKLSADIRRTVGEDYALGAIVPDQRSTSSGNVLWPAFPYAAAANYYDVFLPMAYSSYRGHGASYVYPYSRANVSTVRALTGRPVHLIGGLTDALSASEDAAVVRGARDGGAIGASFYDFALGQDDAWRALTLIR
jgi:hypothetical protein